MDIIDRITLVSNLGWLVILILGLIAGVVAFAVAWGILKAAEKPAPTLLVMSLSMLTLLSIVAFTVTGSQEMSTLSGVGLGALAAAVASMFGGRPDPPVTHSPLAEPPPPSMGEPVYEAPVYEEPVPEFPEEKDEGA